AVQVPLDQQIAQCDATRDAALANCKHIYPDGSQSQADCIENAEVAAFSCREDAREASRPGFAQCQKDFVSCAQGCPASPSGAFTEWRSPVGARGAPADGSLSSFCRRYFLPAGVSTQACFSPPVAQMPAMTPASLIPVAC